MSKLAELIRRTSRGEAASIGFRAAKPARKRSLVLAVLLAGAEADKAAAAAAQGADALLLRLDRADDGKLEAALKAAGDIPCGVWLEELASEAVATLAEKGVDYLVFKAESTPAAALLEEKPGYVLALSGGEEDTYLRTLDALALDAVFLPDWQGPLTVQRQLGLRRVAGLARKPLMLPPAPLLEGPELECLRDAGVSLLVLDGNDKEALAALPALRERIEALPTARRRREHADVLLPSTIGMAMGEEEEGEEEEE